MIWRTNYPRVSQSIYSRWAHILLFLPNYNDCKDLSPHQRPNENGKDEQGSTDTAPPRGGTACFVTCRVFWHPDFYSSIFLWDLSGKFHNFFIFIQRKQPRARVKTGENKKQVLDESLPHKFWQPPSELTSSVLAILVLGVSGEDYCLAKLWHSVVIWICFSEGWGRDHPKSVDLCFNPNFKQDEPRLHSSQ